jgi:hypothetical protein
MSKKQTKSKKEPDISIQSKLIDEKIAKLSLEKQLILEKGLQSKDADTLFKANLIYNQYFGKQQEQVVTRKSLMFDPYLLNEMMGFKDKYYALSYNTLRTMAKTPIIKAIIGTRVEQVASFSGFQNDYSKLGWTIRKKGTLQHDLEDNDKKEIDRISKFIQEGGIVGDSWGSDDFDDFLRKIVPDSLALDQWTTEIVRSRGGDPVEYFATDGATYRFAESKNPENSIAIDYNNILYYPKYVQILDSQIVSEFYPWELIMGIRNPTTDIYKNGYGRSELEDMIKIVTWMLYGDNYNGKFFSQGAAPKGIIRLSGNVNDGRLAEFKQQWQAQVAGVQNAWKTPVLEADKMDFLNMQMSNQDMQFSNWQEYLIKLGCAQYKIDPSEIGFPMGGSANTAQFEADRKYKLEYSQEKGLLPLLKHIQRKINKSIISQLNSSFEFVFTGLENEDEAKLLENDIKALGNFMGYKEIRKKRGLPEDLEDPDDMIFNSMYYQMKMASKQQGGGGGMGGMMGGGEGEQPKEEESEEEQNPFLLIPRNPYDRGGLSPDNPYEGGGTSHRNPFRKKWWEDEEEEIKQQEEGENPFMKSFYGWIDELIEKDK